MTSYSRKRTVHRPNLVDRMERSERDWHVRCCLLENLTPADWQAMDLFEADRSYWDTCSLINLKASIDRLNEGRIGLRPVDTSSAEADRKALFG